MNNRCSKSDIITAQATPYGKSALAVIRVSGSGCIELVERFINKPLRRNRIALYVFDAGNFTEQLMATCYKAPRSYTGEDEVELFPHGNTVIVEGIIKTLISAGARAAERGEFTERAFSNGKVDLIKCEALADIIDAETAEQLKYGNERYFGGFDGLENAEKILNRALSTVEAVIHYSDELEENEIDEGLLKDVYGSIGEIISILEAEANGYAGGRVINDGFRVALIGKPNVGKSTLLNALTGKDRAIVTPIAGTTRDTIDGGYVYKGRKFIVTDTAGLNESASDEVEKIGISRAKAAAEKADAIVYVSAKGEKIEFAADKPVVAVENKWDDAPDVGEDYASCSGDNGLKISAKLNKNTVALKQRLYDLCPKAVGGVCNHRQYECVMRCLDACRAAKSEAEKTDGLEIVAAELYNAYSAIEELFGSQADEKVIDSVFERFCVGK